MQTEYYAFFLTLMAGLATGIGSLIALLAKRTNKSFLSVALGFSAGVMIYVSMVEILNKARACLDSACGSVRGGFLMTAAFFGGIALIALLNRLLPSEEDAVILESSHQTGAAILTAQGEAASEAENENRLMRTGVFTALAIGIHNLPEGLATFVSGLSGGAAALPIATAIAIHNIPEGIAVSVPVYYAGGSRKKAFVYSFLSGLTEPLGALIGYTILRPFINDIVFGIVFAAVAGIMVYISLEELLPSARAYGGQRLTGAGMVLGMAVMAVSLLLLS